MKRVLFTAAAAGSAVLCILLLTLWVHSQFVSDQIGHFRPGAFWFISSSRGQLAYCRNGGNVTYFRETGQVTQPLWWWDRTDPELEEPYSRSGFLFEFGGPRYGLMVGLPHWFLAFLAAIPPMLGIVIPIRQRRHRRANNLCAGCGYDLRATPDRCPECGMVAK